jgi:hypothetical protein
MRSFARAHAQPLIDTIVANLDFGTAFFAKAHVGL